MSVLSAQELLRKNNIPCVDTRKGKYTTNCPSCGLGYLNVEIKRDAVVWFCHACDQGGGEPFDQDSGYEQGEVLEKGNGLGPIKACYDYLDESGKRLFQVLRFEPLNAPKQFRQRTGPEQTKWSIKDVRIVPFMLPELIEAVAHERTVFVCEGEKDVLRLQELHVPATCNPMGAGKWWPEFNEILRDADVVVCGDNDAPGRAHMQLVASNLAGVAQRLRVLDLAQHGHMEPSDDVSDWLANGGTADKLWEIVERLPDYQPAPLSDEQAINGRDQAAPAEPSRPTHPTTYVIPEEASMEPRSQLFAKHYIRRVPTATVAPGGVGKTTLALYEALCMAVAGINVWFISGEDPLVELDRRIAAHLVYHKVVGSQIDGHLFVDDRSTWPLSIAKATRSGAVQFDEDWLARFQAAIIARKIDVVIIDPLISFHGVPESDNGATDAVMKRVGAITMQCNCNIESLHHSRKAQYGQTELTVDDARGAGAIVNAVRSCRVINRMSEREANLANIPQDKRSLYLRVDRGKHNMTPPEAATWFMLKSVHLANGDNVQALEPWTFPSAFVGVSPADVDWVQQLLGDRPRRASARSVDWLGHALGERFNHDTTSKEGAIWANRLIGQWLANKVFKQAILRDPAARKPFSFYVANGYRSGEKEVQLTQPDASEDDENNS